jgi:hypothetical protein
LLLIVSQSIALTGFIIGFWMWHVLFQIPIDAPVPPVGWSRDYYKINWLPWFIPSAIIALHYFWRFRPAELTRFRRRPIDWIWKVFRVTMAAFLIILLVASLATLLRPTDPSAPWVPVLLVPPAWMMMSVALEDRPPLALVHGFVPIVGLSIVFGIALARVMKGRISDAAWLRPSSAKGAPSQPKRTRPTES